MKYRVKTKLGCRERDYASALVACSAIANAVEEATANLITGEPLISSKTVNMVTSNPGMGVYYAEVTLDCIAGNRKHAENICGICNSVMSKYSNSSVAIDLKPIPEPVGEAADVPVEGDESDMLSLTQ